MRVFIDTNILMDWLLEDRPCKQYAKVIITAAEEHQIQLAVSSQSILDAAYITKKSGLPFESFRNSLNYLRSFARIVSIDEVDLMWALAHYSGDFEDDAQYGSAYNSVCDFFITRDKKIMELNDQFNPMTVISPEEFVAKMTGE